MRKAQKIAASSIHIWKRDKHKNKCNNLKQIQTQGYYNKTILWNELKMRNK